MSRIFQFIILLVIFSFFLYLLYNNYSFVSFNSLAIKNMAPQIIILAVSLYLILSKKNGLWELLSRLFFWGVVFFGLLVIYVIKDDIKTVAINFKQSINPSNPVNLSPGVLEISSDNNGHYNVISLINGVKVKLLIDTGATVTSLSLNDAKRIGIDIDNLNYNMPVSTAAGMVMVASAEIDSIQINNLIVNNLKVNISNGSLGGSLLGMNFLSKLEKFEVQNGKIRLFYQVR